MAVIAISSVFTSNMGRELERASLPFGTGWTMVVKIYMLQATSSGVRLDYCRLQAGVPLTMNLWVALVSLGAVNRQLTS